MPATISELSARLKLSKGTVSRILNNTGAPFAEDTRRRVFAMAEELGYQPNPVARALATGRTGFVALWVRDLLSSYHAHVVHAVEEQLEKNGYHVVVALHGKGSTSPDTFLPTLGGVDAIIAHDHRWVSPRSHMPQRIPVISTGVGYDPECLDYVAIDLAPIAVEAVRHLIQPGRRRIAYLMYDLVYRVRDPRYEAYRAVMEEAGLPVETLEPPREDRASVRAFVREYIEAKGCPEAIFCHSDDIAIATYRALCDLSIRVPDDVALLGCDGIEDTEYMATPLSTMAQPIALMCETAWQFLERRLAEPDAPPQRIVLHPTLLLRESTR